MNPVTKERLLEIAETEFEDVEVMISAMREIALAVAQQMDSKAPSAPAQQRQAPSKRVQGRPIPPELRRTTCKDCHADVVVFISKRTSNPYLCDMELGYYENRRQLLSGANWLHQCGGGR